MAVLYFLIKLVGELQPIGQTDFEFLDEQMIGETAARESAVIVKINVERGWRENVNIGVGRKRPRADQRGWL
jgi:hypothetical protein